MRTHLIDKGSQFLAGGRPIRIRTLGVWGQVDQTAAAVPAGMKCYSCGMQGVRAMTPAMAAMVPGGCIEVDATQCGAAAAPVTGTGNVTSGQTSNPWTAPSQQPSSDPDNYNGPIEITIGVVEPNRLEPYPGANVSISLVNKWTGATSSIGSGVTDGAGKFTITDRPPSPNHTYTYKVRVSPGAGQDFPVINIRPDLASRSIEAMQSMTGKLDYGSRTVVVDLPGTPSLVYDVAERQLLYKEYFVPDTLATMKGFIWLIREEFIPRDNGFVRNINVYAPWLADANIKPEQWPALTQNWDQFIPVWEAVPWPRGARGIDNFFIDCMNQMPFYNGMTVYDPRFYLSDFFPKTDDEIRRAIAKKSLEDMMAIFDCINRKVISAGHKVTRRAERLRKQAAIIKQVLSIVGLEIINAAITFLVEQENLDSAEKFSKFMMGYKLFVEECREDPDVICEFMAPFILWAMETLLLADFFDNVAIQLGLPGAAPGVTQEKVVKPMVEEMKASGLDVPEAVYTPGGVAPKTNMFAVAGGVGVIGVIAAVLYGAFKS